MAGTENRTLRTAQKQNTEIFNADTQSLRDWKQHGCHNESFKAKLFSCLSILKDLYISNLFPATPKRISSSGTFNLHPTTKPFNDAKTFGETEHEWHVALVLWMDFRDS